MKYLFVYSKMCLFISLLLFSLSQRVSAEGVIVVTTSPSGADIYFAGTYVGNSSATLSGYPPGTYSFSASMSGYETGYTTVVLEKGLDAYGTIYLTALPEPTRPTKKPTEAPYKPPEKAEGYVHISSSPAGASVSVDGSYRGTAPTGVTLSRGSHSVTFYLEGYESSSQSVWVEGGGNAYVHAELIKSQKAGKLVIKSSPDGAIVYINENKSGKTPYNKEHNPGKYTVKLQKKNYIIFKQQVIIEEEKTKQLSIELKPLPGSISIKGNPEGATVFLNGKEKGSIPCVIKKISTGTHVLDVKQEGYNTYSSKIKVSAGENVSLDITLTEYIKPTPTEEPSPVEETPTVSAEETPAPPFAGQSSILLIILLVAIIFFVGTIIVLIKLQHKRKKGKPLQKSEPELLNKQIDGKFFPEKSRQEQIPNVTTVREFSFDELLKPQEHFIEEEFEDEVDDESYDDAEGTEEEEHRPYSHGSLKEYKKPSQRKDTYRTYEMEQLYERDEEDYFEDTEEEHVGFPVPSNSVMGDNYGNHTGSDVRKAVDEYAERPRLDVRKPVDEYEERPSQAKRKAVDGYAERPGFDVRKPVDEYEERPSQAKRKAVDGYAERPGFDVRKPVDEYEERPGQAKRKAVDEYAERPGFDVRKLVDEYEERPGQAKRKAVDEYAERPGLDVRKPVGEYEERPGQVKRKAVDEYAERPGLDVRKPVGEYEERPGQVKRKAVDEYAERPRLDVRKPVGEYEERPGQAKRKAVDEYEERPGYDMRKAVDEYAERPRLDVRKPVLSGGETYSERPRLDVKKPVITSPQEETRHSRELSLQEQRIEFNPQMVLEKRKEFSKGFLKPRRETNEIESVLTNKLPKERLDTLAARQGDSGEDGSNVSRRAFKPIGAENFTRSTNELEVVQRTGTNERQIYKTEPDNLIHQSGLSQGQALSDMDMDEILKRVYLSTRRQVPTKANMLLGNYTVTEKIGSGSMAKVYKATYTDTGEIFAIKIPYEHLLNDEGFINRFFQETDKYKELNHPNIVKVYDALSNEDSIYMIMEFVDAMTLRELLRLSGISNMDVVWAINFVIKVCEGLNYLHSRRIIHSDIKPENLMVTPESNVKIMEYVTVKSVDQIGPTKGGFFAGSPHYMPCELLSKDGGDERSDIYSLGVVFYELITGNVPFSGSNPLIIMKKHKEEEPIPPRKIVPSIPEEIEKIVLKMLAKAPRDRFSSVRVVSALLSGYLTMRATDKSYLKPKPINYSSNSYDNF